MYIGTCRCTYNSRAFAYRTNCDGRNYRLNVVYDNDKTTKLYSFFELMGYDVSITSSYSMFQKLFIPCSTDLSREKKCTNTPFPYVSIICNHIGVCSFIHHWSISIRAIPGRSFYTSLLIFFFFSVPF